MTTNGRRRAGAAVARRPSTTMAPILLTLLLLLPRLCCSLLLPLLLPPPPPRLIDALLRPDAPLLLSPPSSSSIVRPPRRAARVRLRSTTDDGRATDADIDASLADEARRIALLSRGRGGSGSGSGGTTIGGGEEEDGARRRPRRPGDNMDREWQFFDTARVHVTAGSGGNGCVAFRREKGEAMGGPNGGRGGRGGSVVFVADSGLSTLAGLRDSVHVRASSGTNGAGKNRDGRAGDDARVRVPCGTIVRELRTQKVAGEVRTHGQELVVAPGGRGGRGNAAFMTSRRTSPKLSELGEPGVGRWLSVELRLVADVGFLGFPNAGKSTLLASSSAARPKVANYPFTTIVPNLGVCDLGEDGGGSGLVLCDIPGLIEGAAMGAGLGFSFLRHVRRCKVLLHVVDGTSDDPVGDFVKLNGELAAYDASLANKPQVVVLNKVDVTEVREREDGLLRRLREAAGHSRVMSISAATKENVKELMGRLKKFVDAEKKRKVEGGMSEDDDVVLAEVDLSKAALDSDSDDYGKLIWYMAPVWRVKGEYIEQVAKMTHWEYPEAVERFGRLLQALGIRDELSARGAMEGDLVMIDEYDFDFSPAKTNIYIPQELLDKDAKYEERENAKRQRQTPRGMLLDNDYGDVGDDEGEEALWKPFDKGGYMLMDKDEIVEFNDEGEWDLLEDDFDLSPELLDGDEVWTS
ncbi:hypothetical protein ACHAW5_004350 [Stephanodiscus triporus]|uniref:Obg family GTPase CgtA n=1 Tax=Stephanodiscus triporus TaxID=2934178 RepID=A0ABD3Q309_9STRA